MMSQEMQNEFEAFCAMEGDRAVDKAQLMRGFMWAWKRSRAAVVVELPQEETMCMFYAPDVVSAIEAAGLKVKP